MKISLYKSTHMLTVILVAVMLIVIITTIQQLYDTAFQQASERLMETVRSQSQLIETTASNVLKNDTEPYTAENQAIVLTLISQAFSGHKEFGENGNFILAKQVNGEIVFILGHPSATPAPHQTNSFQEHDVALPMKLALEGKSGTLITVDYRGEEVLAAYQPIKLLNYGIVAHTDLAEFRKPFIRASVISMSVGVILIFAGAVSFHLITTPLLNRIYRSEYRMRLLLDSTADGVFGINMKGHCTFTNAACLKLLGYSETKQLLGKSLVDILEQPIPSDKDIYLITTQDILRDFQTAQKNLHYEVSLCHPNGKAFIAEIRLSPVIKNGHCIGAVILFADITQQKDALAQKQLANTVYENIEEGIIVTNAKAKIVSVNSAFEHITGYKEGEALGRNPRFLKSGQQDRNFYVDMWQQIVKNGSWKGVIWNKKKDGKIVPLWSSISSVKDPAGRITHFVGAISDISTLKAKEEMLEHMAHHDPLTGLPNRLLLDARFELSLQNSARRNSKLAVLFIDLDNFKEINDLYGHKAGDQLLIETARHLQQLLREEDTVSRLGGDEFVILLSEVNEVESVLELAEKIKLSINQSLSTDDGIELKVDSSIGIALYPDHGRDTSSLLSRADNAMYKAKNRGKNCICLFQFDDSDEKV